MDGSVDKPSPPRHAWGRARRQALIDFRLLWEGRINRRDLTEFFGISTPQASADLQDYVKRQGSGVEYDPREKTYVATAAFRPTLVPDDADSYLYELLARWSGFTNDASSFIEALPPMDTVPLPLRTVQPRHLVQLLHSIRANIALRIQYQSTTRPEPIWRTISPLALVFDGLRWHVRAYCHIHYDFRDFVMSRILDTGNNESALASLQDDRLWHTKVTVELGPDSRLSEGYKNALVIDYDMTDGRLAIDIRAALLFYLFQRLGLSLSGWEARPEVRQLELLNEDQLRRTLGASFPDGRKGKPNAA